MYVNSSACVRVKWGESERFRIDSEVRWRFHVPLAVQCIYGWSDEGGEWRFLEDGREWKLPSLLYADDLVL